MTLADLFAIIDTADRDGPVPHPRSAELTGISGRKTIALLQRLAAARASDAHDCYVEIGVFQGLTMLSVALAVPRLPCIGIDNFSILDPKGENLAIVERRLASFGAPNVTLVNADYETALASFAERFPGKKIGVYFVDGAHDYRSQLMGLLLGLPHLAGDAAVVIDDANYDFVRRATHDFLVTHPEWKLVFEAYSPAHPANLAPDALKHHEAGWLNGIHMLARDPDGLLVDMFPPLADDRALYVNDWLVHRHGLAALAPESLAFASAVVAGDVEVEQKTRAELVRRHARLAASERRQFPDRNTQSAGLPDARRSRFR